MDKNQRQARQEEEALYKAFGWIGGAVILEILLLVLNRFYVNYTVDQIDLAEALRVVLDRLAVILPVCFVVLLVVTLLLHRARRRILLTAVATLAAFVLALCAIIILIFDASGIHFLYVAVPVLAVLALIYYLYQREFFFGAVLGVLGLVGVKVIPRRLSTVWMGYGYLVALGAILLVSVIVFRMLQSGDGTLRIGGKQKEILSRGANYALLYATCGIVAAVTVAVLLVGAMAVFYGVLVAWLLILAVYYTVRMM